MKKSSYVFVGTAIVTLVCTIIATNIASAQTLSDAENETGIGASIDDSAGANPGAITNNVREKLREAAQERTDNAGENNSLRNQMLEQRSSTTDQTVEAQASATEERANIKADGLRENAQIHTETANELRDASSTQTQREVRQNEHFDMFKNHQDELVSQLSLAVSNLEQIAGRISDRIDTASANGIDMTQAKQLLAVAQNKITVAKAAILSVQNYTPTAVTASTTANASTTVDLSKPRRIGSEAIQTIKDARDALIQVVRAIAHAMGLKLGIEATSTMETGSNDSSSSTATSTTANASTTVTSTTTTQ
ncbi:hypothetical protein KGQ27_00450 [Patescibacteria group bacterium]|nr:hypothetical protein [Patescibacteria group bacterium]MDE1946683.1 hypothetical protein [Patescibacteria group bacterium]MDE2010636.1 hypothetical protein [Patescibacteria group bacterium]MDE2233308.1 hypothetical protein [Patescibacteria group bacterium]